MNYEQLAQSLIDGNITLAQWQLAMKESIRTIHREATILAMGGRQNVTFSMWGFLGSLVKKQYRFLDGFAADIAANPGGWLNGRLLVRMNMYAKADFNTFELVLERIAREKGKTEERRVLGVADHCPCCLSQASLSWSPLGTLLDIGECVCLTNCRCHKEYR